MTGAVHPVPLFMREEFGAVVLAGTLEVTPAPLAVLPPAAPVRRTVRAMRAPLDLDANVFRYRVRPDDSIVAVRRRRGARLCREPHHRLD